MWFTTEHVVQLLYKLHFETKGFSWKINSRSMCNDTKIHMYIKETLEFHGDKNGAWKLENGANTFNESGWPFTCICFVLIATWSILRSERLKIGSADLHCPIFWKPSHDWGSYYIPLVYIYFVLFANLMLNNPNEENSTSMDLYKLTWTPTTS